VSDHDHESDEAQPSAPPRSANDTIRVLVADDHALFRRGLNMILDTESGIEVVAEAEDGVEAVQKAVEFTPDVVLMDVRMPRMSGIEAAARVRESVPSAKILMLTVSDEEEDLYEAVKAGANGYLLQEISIEEVADAIRAVTQGQSLISPSMASKLLAEFKSLSKQADDRSRPHLKERGRPRPGGGSGPRPPA
jgi:two-component system NarL family response regulator